MSEQMKISQFIKILERVKDQFGDLPVEGSCEECGSSGLNVWTMWGPELGHVEIQVSGVTGEEEDEDD